MKLLLDRNLSRFLVGELAVEYPDSTHVAEAGLAEATDREVWEHARKHGYVIVSKDSDFRQLAFVRGAPPKVIWLQVGNAATCEILALLRDRREAMEAFGWAESEALLVLPRLEHPAGPR